jgi:DNA modification methylase
VSVRILTGDCRDVLRSLPDESVHCVVTSPPYWGMRRDAVLIELNPEYAAMAERRIRGDAPLFAQVAAE